MIFETGRNVPPIPRRHLVLIAAAAAAVCGENTYITGIVPAESKWNGGTWASRPALKPQRSELGGFSTRQLPRQGVFAR